MMVDIGDCNLFASTKPCDGKMRMLRFRCRTMFTRKSKTDPERRTQPTFAEFLRIDYKGNVATRLPMKRIASSKQKVQFAYPQL